MGTLLHGVGRQAKQSGQANLDYLPQWREKFAPNTLAVFKNCFNLTHLQIPLYPQWLSCFLPPHAWLILTPRSFSLVGSPPMRLDSCPINHPFLPTSFFLSATSLPVSPSTWKNSPPCIPSSYCFISLIPYTVNLFFGGVVSTGMTEVN